MKPEMLEIVLNELLQEQKGSNLVNGELATYIKSLTEKLEVLDKKVTARQQSQNTELTSLLQALQEDMKHLKNDIAGQKTPVIYKRVFQLFPSFNIREYYQVYGNMVKWLSIFGCAYLLAGLIRDLLGKLG